jgi:hypothetical protein
MHHQDGSSAKAFQHRFQTEGFSKLRDVEGALGDATVSTLVQKKDPKLFLANLTRTRPVAQALSTIEGRGKLPAFEHSMSPIVDAVIQIHFQGEPTHQQLEALGQLKESIGSFADVSMSRSRGFNVLGKGLDKNASRLAFVVPWDKKASPQWTEGYWRAVHAPAAGNMISRGGFSSYAIFPTTPTSDHPFVFHGRPLFDDRYQGICFEDIPKTGVRTAVKGFVQQVRANNALAVDEVRLAGKTASPVRLNPVNWQTASAMRANPVSWRK